MSGNQSTFPAVVLVAHHQPEQLHRLVRALDPLPIFLHIDANTSSDVYAAMVDGLPSRVQLLPRLAAGWASPAVLQAELLGYRAALTQTHAEHIVLLTGACYPLCSTARLSEILARHRGRSFAYARRMPVPEWRPLGGFDRLVVPQRPEGGRRRIVGPPRLWPRGIVPAGGSQSKILAREHAEKILLYLEEHPRANDFFLTCWIPDEVVIPSLLRSPATGIDWPRERGYGNDMPWFMAWAPGSPHPAVLTEAHWDALRASTVGDEPRLFARKIGPESAGLLNRIDSELRL